MDPLEAPRAIDRVLEGNAHSERVRAHHRYFSEALDGFRTGACSAADDHNTAAARELRVQAQQLDSEYARQLTAIAARAT
jgi:hypothetical protein